MKKMLFVSNLSITTTECDLKALFRRFGGRNASVAMHPKGRSRGFARIEVNEDAMDAAILAIDGKFVAGSKLSVKEAKP